MRILWWRPSPIDRAAESIERLTRVLECLWHEQRQDTAARKAVLAATKDLEKAMTIAKQASDDVANLLRMHVAQCNEWQDHLVREVRSTFDPESRAQRQQRKPH